MEPRVIWYRASSECPQGPEFLGKLAERANLARLAGAGDHIDFVVTLQSFDGETVGRLERQTQSGTVAIRELRDASCPRVAEALALSLALSLEPANGLSESRAKGEPKPAEAPATETASAAPSAIPAAFSAAPASRVRAEQSSPVATPPLEGSPSQARTLPRADDPRGGWLGIQGGALLGVAPRALPRAALFLGIEDPWPAGLPGASLRFAVVGALGSAATSVGPVQRWLLSGRAEGCPLRWGNRAVSVAPCLAIEIGATGASDEASSTRDTGLWAAGAASARAALRLTPGLSLEAQAEAQLPLYRNDVYAGRQAVYRAQPVAFQGGLAASMRLW